MTDHFTIRKQLRWANPMNKKIVDQSAVKFGDFLLGKNCMYQSHNLIYIKQHLHVLASNAGHHHILSVNV
jgi:hypothetical protein